MSLFRELKRRNVFRVVIAYLAFAWLLIEVAGTLFPGFGIPDWAFRFVVILLALGFIPALIFSWTYEITPEGVKREKDAARDKSNSHLSNRHLDGITIALVAMVVVFTLADRLWFSPGHKEQIGGPATSVIDDVQPAAPELLETQRPSKSIAVLPFTDMSENQDQGWFADGLAEEILNTLVRTPDLMVSSRTSSFAYKGMQLPIPQIAGELGVAHVLEGSVRRSGDRIRVTAQLIRAGDGFHIWSESYDRSTKDVIKIQEDLAINIAKALKTTMDPEALKKMLWAGTRSVEAHEYYLNGLASIARLVEKADFNLNIDALNYFDKALEEDPGFAAAYHQSARIWRDRCTTVFSSPGAIDVTYQQAYAKFREKLTAAIENAPGETQRMIYEAELAINELRGAKAVRLLRQVLEKLPNSSDASRALIMAAVYSADTEAYNLAMENLLRLRDIQATMVYVSYARYLAPTEQNVANVLEQVKRFPNSTQIIFQAYRDLLWFEEFEEAHKLYPDLIEETGNHRWLTDIRQACSMGDREMAEKILRMAREQGANETVQWHILMLLGEQEEAARVLKIYESEQVPFTLGAFLAYEQFDPRPFPALMSVLKREGLDWPPPREIPFACPPKDGE